MKYRCNVKVRVQQEDVYIILDEKKVHALLFFSHSRRKKRNLSLFFDHMPHVHIYKLLRLFFLFTVTRTFPILFFFTVKKLLTKIINYINCPTGLNCPQKIIRGSISDRETCEEKKVYIINWSAVNE